MTTAWHSASFQSRRQNELHDTDRRRVRCADHFSGADTVPVTVRTADPTENLERNSDDGERSSETTPDLFVSRH